MMIQINGYFVSFRLGRCWVAEMSYYDSLVSPGKRAVQPSSRIDLQAAARFQKHSILSLIIHDKAPSQGV